MYEWREDMKRLLRKAGLEKKPVTFLFADNQVKGQGIFSVFDTIEQRMKMQECEFSNKYFVLHQAREWNGVKGQGMRGRRIERGDEEEKKKPRRRRR